MFSPNLAKPVVKAIWLSGLFAFPLSLPLRAQPPSPQPGSRQLLTSVSILDSNREQDGLFGPVRRVRAETAQLSLQAGKSAEGPRLLLETTTYAPRGQRVENISYPVAVAAQAPDGREEYRYDDKGNIIEKTLRDEAGNALSKEAYAYEFDSFGNWIKMTTSIVVLEADRLSYEPTEVTYRTISYYFDEAVAKKLQPPAAAATTAEAAVGAPVANPATKSAESGPLTGAGSDGQPTAANESATTVKLPALEFAPALLTTSSLSLAPPTAAVTEATGNGELVKTSDPLPPPAGPFIETSDPLPPVAQPAAKPDAKLAFGETVGAKALFLPQPVYPESAVKAGLQGIVTVKVFIDPSGQVSKAEALSGPQPLQSAAVEAAKRARFAPARIAGQPARSTVTINYNFKDVR